MNDYHEDTEARSIKHNLSIIYALSLCISVLIATAASAGILFQERLYPTLELRRSFLTNDYVILFIGLPMLLGSMWATWFGSLLGLLFWPGALVFVLYNYFIYVFALPFNLMFLLSLLLVMLSIYTLISLLTSMNGTWIRQRLADVVPERFAGGVLAGLGFLFFLRAFAALAIALAGQTTIEETELALLATDLLIAPAWMIGGLLLWQRKEFGYISGLGLLFQASMLFIGLIIVLLMQPSMTGSAFVLSDVIVVFAMGLVCFIPFALFIRGVLSSVRH